ncbi:MAG: Cys-Gln thioester bond-forming surface protein [Candidatus Solibacter sp.]|nr:Cys-Gln thioester bond-forming surface protein [Candidatus Solibacter sp.]
MVTKRFILLALLAVCPALANTIIVVGTHNSLGQTTWINETAPGGTPTNLAAWAGGIDINIDGYSRVVFCVDLFTDINASTYKSVLGPPDTDRLKRVGWLLQNQFPTDAAHGAAFQLAIWDIMHDTPDGFDLGSVRRSTDSRNPTSDAVINYALQYETASVGKSSTHAVVYHNSLNGVPVQTLIGSWPNDGGPVDATPEPAAKVLIVSGLALMGLSRVHRGPQS